MGRVMGVHRTLHAHRLVDGTRNLMPVQWEDIHALLQALDQSSFPGVKFTASWSASYHKSSSYVLMPLFSSLPMLAFSSVE